MRISDASKKRSAALDALESSGYGPGTKLFDLVRAAFDAETNELAEKYANSYALGLIVANLSRPRGVVFNDGSVAYWNGVDLVHKAADEQEYVGRTSVQIHGLGPVTNG